MVWWIVAADGLQVDHGVRRTSRSHHRPLEYWRNEKKVFARPYRSVFDSLSLDLSSALASSGWVGLPCVRMLRGVCALSVGLPTVDHIETRTPEPSWPRPSAKKRRKRGAAAAK